MFCEKLTEEQIRKVMNVISDDGALTILKIRTYDKSFEDAVAVSAVPEVTAKFQEDIETYQLHDYFIRGKNRAGAGSDYIYRKMMYEWFGEPYVVKYVKRLKDDEILQIMRVISDPDCEIVSIFRKVTDPEVVINSQDMEERYVLHDYDIEGFDYLPDDSTRMYRKEMLRIFGEKYAADYMLRR